MDIKSLKRNFDEWGKHDPLWTVLTEPDKQGNKWKRDEFFATGVEQVGWIMKYLETVGVDPGKARALDFGCGVGRLSQALADHFDEVCGVDIAASMIRLADEYNRHGGKVKYCLNTRDDLSIFGRNEFDFVLTMITLQHMEPRYSKKYIKEFIRILKPGGVMVIQIPESYGGQSLGKRIERSIRYRIPVSAIKLIYRIQGKEARPPLFEMYGIDYEEVERLIKDNGARIIDAISTSGEKDPHPGFQYCVKKNP